MKTVSRSVDLYDHIVIVSMLLFLKSMRLYSLFASQWLNNRKITRNARVQKSLEQIIETIQTCASGFERLPEPPLGAEAADQRFRELGREMYAFAGILRSLSGPNNGAQIKTTPEDFRNQAERVKRSSREAILLYERAYPGQLTGVLQSMQQAEKYDLN